MRGKTLGAILFGVSLIAVIFAVMNSSRRGDASLPPQQVLAATVELSAGTLLREQDITWQPILNPQPDQFARPSEVQIKAKPDIVEETVAGLYGAVLRHSLATGTPIRRGDIVKPGDRDFLQVVLPPGMRAIAVPVSTGGASTGLLTPGDHVDVVLTQNFTHEGSTTPVTRRSVGETIVQSLRVLAINAPDTKPGASNNAANGNFGRTVTLQVTPEQAETINVAAELGKLSVTLRSGNMVAGSPETAGGPDVSYDPTRRLGLAPASPVEPIKAKWAGDVSPALFSAAQPKPEAIKPTPITIIRGGHKGGREVIEPDGK